VLRVHQQVASDELRQLRPPLVRAVLEDVLQDGTMRRGRRAAGG
jgi:hypothetical protein